VGATGAKGTRIYATCPQSKDLRQEDYLAAVGDVARWSEDAGCAGILVYTDNGLVDPWLVSDQILRSTESLRPLVAVQPVYMHPYAAAKMVASLAFLHGRPVDLNMLAGGFKNDLIALGDRTPHDDRYARTTEYAQIMLGLLRGEAVTLAGTYYGVERLSLTPRLAADLAPRVLVSGSSPAGLEAARALDATPVKYPHPPGEEEPPDGIEFGVRVGIVARDDEEEAWRVALDRFPEDRAGQITHRLAMQTSDSQWHRQLSERPAESPDGARRPTYWLGPFHNYQTFCPYLVGDHATVAAEIARYRGLGATTFILDIPPSRAELEQIERVFALAEGQ